MPKKKKKTNDLHYVDNKKFLEELKKWLLEFKEDDPDYRPLMSEYIGSCFLKIAQGLAHKPNFSGYTYIDEMISDGLENCIAYAHNFNTEKSKNPFAYFTQIIWYAFLRRIRKEKKQAKIRFSCIENAISNGILMEDGVDSALVWETLQNQKKEQHKDNKN